MLSIIEQKLPAIRQLCADNAVEQLCLFGSASREIDFGSGSDVDFIYRFKENEIGELDYADYYFNLLFGLQDLLQRKVDLIAEHKVRNPFLAKHIQSDLKVLYES